ncbi:MAG TPA: amidohydrolase family protein [Gemmatimonadaceae bacterium]|nr:amidohydrolase family protein [Gemmatimonadaceae bacterium]
MSRIRGPLSLLLALTIAALLPSGAHAQHKPRVVTVSDGAADPAVSPDGAQIAVSILGKIWIVPASGGDARQVSNGISWDTHPSWSPDGQFLVYAHEDGDGSDLVITNLATGTSAGLYHTDKDIGQTAFTPKGDEIYFVAQSEQLDAHLMHVPIEGGEAKPVTETHDWHEWSFALSPDGQHVLLASGRYGGADLFRIDLPSRAATRLTNTPWNQFSVAWSGDGKTFYYIRSVNAIDSIMAMPAAGGTARTVFTSPYDDKALALSPNGSTAVLCAARKLYRLDLRTGTTMPIPFAARFVLPAQSVPDMVITHARLWDGTGAAPVADRTIEIRGGRIAAIGGNGAPNAMAGVPVIDAHGRTVMPALMDNHYHFWDYQQGPFLLSRGITNIRDPGAPLSLSMNFKEAIALGLFPGPDIYSAGPLIDGLGDYHPLVDVMIDDTAAAATVVHAFKAQGVDLLKVYFMLKPDVLCAVVREAHKVGLKVTGHIGVHTSWGQAMDCGIDGLNHIRVWADLLPASEQPQGYNESLDGDKNPVPRMQADWHEIDAVSPRVTALIQRMAKSGVGFDPTLSIQRIDDGMRKSLGLAQFATAQESYRRMEKFVARSQQLGVFLLAGTDDGLLFDELDAYDSAGVPKPTILEAATANGAKWLGKESEFGTIAVGRRADLIIVDGDPLKTTSDIRKIDIVVKDGRIVFRK